MLSRLSVVWETIQRLGVILRKTSTPSSWEARGADQQGTEAKLVFPEEAGWNAEDHSGKPYQPEQRIRH